MAARRTARIIAGLSVLATALSGVSPLGASASGVDTSWYGATPPSHGSGCTACHGGGTTPTVTIQGAPGYLLAGNTTCAMYIEVSGAQTYSGYNAYTSGGTLSRGGSYRYYGGSLEKSQPTTGSWGGEMTHTTRIHDGSVDRMSWCWQAPSTPGYYYIYAWANSVDGTGTTSFDMPAFTYTYVAVCADADGDGYYSNSSPGACPGTRDCNDLNWYIRPNATEVCDNVDNNCAGSPAIDEGCDDDNDNYCDWNMSKAGGTLVSTCTSTPSGATAGDDCNDLSPSGSGVNPGANETCNNIDDDCNGSPAIDEGCDDDNDGWCDWNMWKTAGLVVSTCSSTPSDLPWGDDCADAVGQTNYNPGIAETCNDVGADNDCDGLSAELTNNVYSGDGCATGSAGVCSAGTRSCSGGVLQCNQTTASSPESCANTGADNDCDGDPNEISPGVLTGSSCSTGLQGICAAGTASCSGGALQCNQTNAQGVESCSNTPADNDCDGDATEINPGIHAGDPCVTGLQGVCSAGTNACSGATLVCNQTTASSAEKCDGLDNNCNGSLDEGCDDDNDDYCDSAIAIVGASPTCTKGGGDCDDLCVNCTPAGTEICDGKDNDCDATADDNIASNTCGLGVCQRTASSCVGGVPQGCTPGAPEVEACGNTGTDNDCDGDLTELAAGTPDVHLGDACATGLAGICSPGTRYCNGTTLSCQQTVAKGTESCALANLGVDNDCDGDTSELTDGVHAGDACQTGLQGICAAGTRACQGGVLTCVQTNQASTETCLNLGVDNDCDGNPNELTNNVLQNGVCVSGQPGECSAGKQTCSGGSLICTPNKTPTTEICDGKDNNCDNQTDNGLAPLQCGTGECRKSVPACAGGANNTCTPGAPVAEACDEKDNDCNGTVDNGCDDDNDNYCDAALAYSGNPTACPLGGGDCDDTATSSRPGAAELCDGEDNNCNGTDDDNVQALTCGVGECVAQASGCTNGVPENCVPKAPAAEICDNLDNDCNGVNDNGVPLSTCGVGECARTGTTCFANSCTKGLPKGEVCDAKDNDCDGTVDNGLAMATCGLGICQRTGTTCNPNSCTPGNPGKEICDGVDNDCNGLPDDSLPVAECGQGACHAVGSTCLPSSCVPLEASAEKCDGIDNDCDGDIDDGCDDDNDGYCDYSLELTASPLCPSGGNDCDDLLADSHPGADEMCDDKDNDCDGTVDDDVTEPSCGVGACKALGTACVDGEAQNCTPGKSTDETCDGVDNDCDGIIDNGLEPLHCGQGACAVEMVSCHQGEAAKCVPNEPTSERCDGVDNDCDGTTDDGDDLCPAGPCVAGVCTHFLENMGGSTSMAGYGGGLVTNPLGPAPLGGGGAGGSGNDVLPGSTHRSVDDDGGCGCRTAPASSSNAGWALPLLAALYWARRRRHPADVATGRHAP